jgi:hypothetical protein
VAEAVNPIEQSKRGGGDHSSRSAQLQSRENEQRALALWIRGATFEQIASAGFGITSASGAWRAVHRGLRRIPEAEATEARKAQLTRLQAIRMHIWNNAPKDPIRAAEALIKLEAREARLLGLDAPVKTEVSATDGRPLIEMVVLRDVLLQLQDLKQADPVEVIEIQSSRDGGDS